MQRRGLSLITAYQFGRERGLENEVDEIRNMQIDGFKNKQSFLRRGYIVKLFQDKGLLDEFIKQHWEWGGTPQGKKRQQVLLGMYQQHQDILESGENSVTAYDLNNYQRRGRVNVGFAPRRLLVRNNQVYVSNSGSNSITLMLPYQLNVSQEVFLRGKPAELVSTENRLWIYVGDADRGGLHVIDSTSNRLNSFIDLQALPMGLAVID